MMVQSVALTVAALLAITGYTRIVDPSFILPANIFWSYSRWSPPQKNNIVGTDGARTFSFTDTMYFLSVNQQ